ncbi:hypothetical protein PI125_g7341 [Phytophthora idaei]|nr:hypothetical protein PI125_g7341 [Phytophthora idaei]KAG3128062.1 hypothetical protein PI126_g21568 [Phytophthora idaei]
MAYLSGELELKHLQTSSSPPCPYCKGPWWNSSTRSTLKQHFTTNVPPRVPLRRTTTHLTLLTELLNANKDVRHGAAMVARLWQNVKILHFDGNHTLRFVFHSRRKADFFVGAALRLQRVSLSWKTLATYALGRTTPPNSSGSAPCVSLVRPASGLRLSYTHSRGKPECKYSTLSGCGTVGRLWYWTLRFDTEDSSQMLRGVIHVRVGDETSMLHHHLHYLRLPCAQCYSPRGSKVLDRPKK